MKTRNSLKAIVPSFVTTTLLLLIDLIALLFFCPQI